MKEVLFVCTHNSSRSQIAEGLLNHYSKEFRAYSAGTEKTFVSPYAIAVLSELGIDITHHRSEQIEEFENMEFDYVITVCDKAKETCPFYPNTKKFIHMGFSDPNSVEENEDNKLNAFRKTRSQLSKWLSIQFKLNIESI